MKSQAVRAAKTPAEAERGLYEEADAELRAEVERKGVAQRAHS
ncbi:hypothetical protein WME97_14800 [Sorangium sp. So ce367]